MSGKIEISRELASYLSKPLITQEDFERRLDARDVLRTLLAKPTTQHSCGLSTKSDCLACKPAAHQQVESPLSELTILRQTCAQLEKFRDQVVEDRLKQKPVAWANDQQLLLCGKSPREDCPNNPLLHNLPRNIAGSALRTDYCNTPLYTSQPAPAAVVLPDRMTSEQALQLTDYPPESAMYWYNKALDDVRAGLDKVKELNHER